MTETKFQASAGAGDYEEWNEIWSGLTDDEIISFRRGAPRTYRQMYQQIYFDDMWSMLGKKQGAKTLEVGAGRGTTSMYLSSVGCDVTMLDLAPQAFAVAEQNFRREGLPVPRFVAADATATGLPADSYDLISSIGLLEHFDDPRPLLVETLRLLKPGGLAFHVVVPTIPESRMVLSYALLGPWKLPPRRLKNAVNKFLGRSTRGKPEEMTRTEFGVEDYRRWLSELDVTDVVCCPYNSYHAPHRIRMIEQYVGLPMYRTHRAVKKLFGRPPWARTLDSLAMCVLVAFRKPVRG